MRYDLKTIAPNNGLGGKSTHVEGEEVSPQGREKQEGQRPVLECLQPGVKKQEA